jgi:hypothetical protein
MSNQYLAASGVAPLTINQNTAAISILPAAQGQKMYFDGTTWQFRADYGDHDFVVGTDVGDYPNVQACFSAVPLVFPTTTTTIKIYIKNSVTEPAGLTIPASCRALVTIGPGVTYTQNNLISLTAGTSVQPTSLLFVGQAPQSSTFSFDRPSGSFAFTKTGAALVRLQFRNIRILKAQAINAGSTAVLVDPAATAFRQVYDRTTFLVGGNVDGYLGNSAVTTAAVSIQITRCTFDTSINPVTGTVSTLTNVIRSAVGTSDIYVDELTIITATGVNGVIFDISDRSPNTVFKNIRVANDALASGNNSNCNFNARILSNFNTFSTVGASNVTVNFVSTLTPATPNGTEYIGITSTTVALTRNVANGFSNATFQDISCTNFICAASVLNNFACNNCTFSSISCGVWSVAANFGIFNSTFINTQITTTAGAFESSINRCNFIGLSITDAVNGLLCRTVQTTFQNLACTGPINFTSASRSRITGSGGANFGTSITVGDSGNQFSQLSNVSVPFTFTNDPTGNPKAPCFFEAIESTSTYTDSTTAANSQSLMIGCTFSTYTVNRNNSGANIANAGFLRCSGTDPTGPSAFTGQLLSLSDCLFVHPITMTGQRCAITGHRTTGFAGMAITLTTCPNTRVANCIIFATGFLSVTTSNFITVIGNFCGAGTAQIAFNDAAGNNYTCVGNKCNTIVFAGGQTKTIASSNNVTVALAVAPTVAPGANG